MINYIPSRDGDQMKDLFDYMCKDIKFDRKLFNQIQKFRVSWSRKSVEYSEFLGSNLLGLHAVRFSTRDDDLLVTGIFNLDISTVYTNILKLPDINKNWSIATNPILQLMTYSMHRFSTDGKLGKSTDDAVRECYFIFAYKVFGSLISHYFKYNTTPAIAKATYEKLSNRFLIKRLGNWDSVIHYRSNDVVPPKGLHVDKIKRYTTDDAVRIANDLQGRIRETIKNIYLVMMDVRENDYMIKSASQLENNASGEETNKEITDRPDKYVNRIKDAMGTTASLIDDDLIYLAQSFVNSSDIGVIRETLINLSDQYDPRYKDSIYLNNVILKTIGYVNTRGIHSNYRDNIVGVVGHMKGYWSSGSVSDPDVKKTKHVIAAVVKKSTKRRTKWVIAANTLATIVYLFMRAIR